MGVLDERTGALLGAINGYCETGSFQVVEEEELLSRFPVKWRVDAACLRAMLGYLEEQNMIEVSFAESGEYCLRPLPEGRMYFERLKRQKKETLLRRIDGLLCAVFGGFSGGLFGSLLAALLIGR